MTTPWTNVNIVTSTAEPSPTGVYALGSADFQWREIHSYSLYSNNIQSNTLTVNNTMNVTSTGKLIIMSGAELYANGSTGTAGDALLTDGSSPYWSAVVTSVGSGTGLSGGPITNSGSLSVNAAYIDTISANSARWANGSISNVFTVGNSSYFVANGNVGIGNSVPTTRLSVGGALSLQGNLTIVGTGRLIVDGSPGLSSQVLYSSGTSSPYWGYIEVSDGLALDASTNKPEVLANNGIVANTSGTFVRANTGLVANSTGLHVLANNGIVANSTGVFVRANTGLVANSTGVFVQANNGIIANSTGVFVLANTGLVANSTGLHSTASVVANSGLVSNATGLHVLANNGIVANSTGVFVRANNGIVANNTGVFVLANNGIVANSTGVFALANTTSGLLANATGIHVNGSVLSVNNATYVNGNTLITVIESLRSNININGGGTVSVSATNYINWSSTLWVTSNGRGTHFSNVGRFEIILPASGSTITGVGGAANRTTTTDGVLLNGFESLYYILPINQVGSGSVDANFRIASYTSALEVPSEWVLICTRNTDDASFYFTNGMRLKAGQSVQSLSHSALSVGSNVYTVGTSVYFVSNGNVGIGTSTPGAKLQISSNSLTVGTSAYFVSNGNLGVGTSTPAHKLDVSGDLAINDNDFILGNSTTDPYIRTGGSSTRGVDLFFGNSSGLTFSWEWQDDRNVVLYDNSPTRTAIWSTGTGISDRNHKTDITITSVLGIEKINNLQVVDFKWKSDSPMYDGGAVHTGFIAQDVAVQHKDAIKQVGNTFLLYKEELIPLLVKAVQEQQQLIEDLQRRISTLESN